MILLVCGGRDYGNHEKLDHCLEAIHAKRGIDLIITGGCKEANKEAMERSNSADEMAEEWADLNCIPRCSFPANWNHQGKGAGLIRNSAALRFGKPDGAVAFGGGKGTDDMVKKCKAAGVPVWEVDRD